MGREASVAFANLWAAAGSLWNAGRGFRECSLIPRLTAMLFLPRDVGLKATKATIPETDSNGWPFPLLENVDPFETRVCKVEDLRDWGPDDRKRFRQIQSSQCRQSGLGPNGQKFWHIF